jgi:chaperone required for assembly of F1-ATPase
MPEALRRRYKTVAVEPDPPGFAIALDGKRAQTPAKRPLVLPREALAQAIALEWEAQGARLDPTTMPMTRLASIALDLVAPRMEEVAANVSKYAETDLLCYRAAAPPELVLRQHAAWQPVLDWAAERYAAPLELAAGIVPRAQPEASLRALRAAVAAHDPWHLSALNLATGALGSLLLALALAERRLDAEAAFAASVLDETFEIEQWGEDAEQMRRRQGLREDIAAALRFFALLAPGQWE